MSSPLHTHTPEELAAKVDAAANLLMEHFEAVQILVSHPDKEGGTCSLFRGRGNWYARQGMAHEFIQADKAQTEAHELSKVLPHPPPDEGEDWKQDRPPV